jgi:hypothetical protein
MDNYEKSKAAELPPVSFGILTRTLYQKCREKDSINGTDLQEIAYRVCGTYQVPPCNVNFSGRQPHNHDGRRLKRKVFGNYNTGSHTINIFKLTAVRQQQITPKVALDTLLHELCHHLDLWTVKLSKTIHSSGFYKRIGQLHNMLMVDDNNG